jgi:hypothetical protein
MLAVAKAEELLEFSRVTSSGRVVIFDTSAERRGEVESYSAKLDDSHSSREARTLRTQDYRWDHSRKAADSGEIRAARR